MSIYTLKELAKIVGGKIVGRGDINIEGVAGIKEAREGEITFLANPKYESYMATTRASAVITDRDGNHEKPILRVQNPYLAFLKVVTLFAERAMDRYPRGIHPTAIVPESVKMGIDVAIGAHAVIGENVEIAARVTVMPLVCICNEVKIGEDCLIYPQVTVRERCEIGKRVIIHSGAVIGSDGFGYAKDGNTHQKIPQIGIVRLEDDVEIGANTTIDRATTGVTTVKCGSKIDNLVQIAHNVVVGEDSVIAAQAGVSGSTELGKNVIIAGQAGLVGHIKMGDGAVVGAQGGVTKSIPPHTRVSGYPAREHDFSRKISAASARLPALLKQFRKLKKRVEILEKELGSDSSTEND